MNLAPIIALLQQRTGLDPGALGEATLRSAIVSRLRSLQMEDLDQYAGRLARDPAEFLALVDKVVVPETWFLRGGDLFFYLAEQARSLLRQRSGKGMFRALSVPCSTGEEPYSLVLALLEIGVPLARCRIDAIDVSPRNIEQAKRGLFSELSFRQMEPALRQLYFQRAESGWQINPALRAAVHFSTGNLLDPGLLRLERPYDLIFCRNLFIYLHASARQAALASLERLLLPGGLLCLGHADSLGPQRVFERTGPEGYFLYCRLPQATSTRPRLPSSLPMPPRTHTAARKAAAAPPASLNPAQAEEEPLATLLARARQQADGGQLAEALALCRSAQDRYGPSADLYSLMGVIFQARHERPEAIHSFRKALYLNQDHPEALLHLMLLYEHQGERTQADVLRRRLQRLGSR
jgi:chemotaxis protein methyltransferase WspC